MNSEELFNMRHPNRLRTRPTNKSARPLPGSKRAERFHPAQIHEASSPQPHHLSDQLGGRHRKWMQNFSLQAGPPLWLLIKQG
jgi:hypothetical protein